MLKKIRLATLIIRIAPLLSYGTHEHRESLMRQAERLERELYG